MTDASWARLDASLTAFAEAQARFGEELANSHAQSTKFGTGLRDLQEQLDQAVALTERLVVLCAK